MGVRGSSDFSGSYGFGALGGRKVKFTRHATCREDAEKVNMARNWPSFGEITQECGHEHEEDAGNPPRTPTWPESSALGAHFALFVS